MNKIKLGWTAISITMVLCVLMIVNYSRTALAESEEAPAGAIYLVDENFTFLSNLVPGESQPSGWDIRAAGGTLASLYADTLKVSDTSPILPVLMSRKFPSQEEGSVTMEFRFKPLTVIDGIKWQLLDGNTAGLSIVTSGSNLVLQTSGGGSVTLQAYVSNTEYGVKAIADLSTGKADVYINGVKKATAQNLANPVEALNRFQLTTGSASTGDFNFTPLKIYKGYAVNERLLSVANGTVPGDWTATPSGGTIKVEQMSEQVNGTTRYYVMSPKPDIYSFRMDAASATGAMGLAKSFQPLAGDAVAEYKIFVPVKTNGLAAELKNGTGTVLKLVTSNGNLAYLDTSGNPVKLLEDYKANLWYSIRVKLRLASSEADIYINGKLKAEDVGLASGISSVDGIRFSTSAADKGTMWLDDIVAYADSPLPSDYVPAPVKVSTGDQLVGVQSCPMWREGNHLGWDMINPFPDRTPLLGFYDEGNPETADWETKWQAEHGIGFQMSCWFRPIGGENSPIKDPFLSSALHDGYFNSKYSDQVDFAIMWENLNSKAADSNDFRNNLVPYWIEYYFKDPRYLKIDDDKPVFTIYNYDQFVNMSGSIAGAKADIVYLRNAVIAAGFDDLILLNVYNGTNSQDLINRRTAGFDAVYAYSWGSFGGHPDYQKLKLTLESAPNELDVIAGLSMGRDDTAWGLSSGYYASPSEFRSLAQWTKDTYIPSLSTDNLGKKLVMLDNWNEFGEGHFLMPAGLSGFGYVDAIRDVFAGSASHTDIVPTQAQKDRIGVLYPEGRVVPNRTLTPPAYSEDAVKSWEFDTAGDAEGWTVLRPVDSLSVADGSLTATFNNTDPGIVSGDHLGIKAEDAPYLKIRMKNNANDIEGRVFFTTELDGDWNETKAMGFYVNPQDDGYTDYYVEMWRNKSWIGNIRQIRIDPVSALGTVDIDYVRALANDSTDIKLYIDGKRQALSQPPLVQDGVPMVPVKDIWLQMGVKSEWDSEAQKYIGVKGSSIYDLTVGSSTAHRDGASISLEHSPSLLSNGTVLVPLTYFRDAFGATVSWEETEGKIRISPAGLIWHFEFADGWTANDRIAGGEVLGGVFSGNSLGVSGGTEPAIVSPDNLNADASSVKRIRVKLRNGTGGNEARIYYKANGDTSWNAMKKLTSYVLPNEPLFREYVFDATVAPEWTGTIQQIKVVPTLETGPFVIDSVQMDTAPALPILGNNLVVDPGMEGSALQAQTYNSALGLDVSQAHSGHQSLKVAKLTRYSSAMFKLNGVVPGQEYRYSIWAKLASAPTLSEPLRLCLQYTVDGTTKQIIMYTSPGLSNNAWTQVQGNYTIAETGTVSNVYLYVYTEVDANNHDYYVDDAEVRPITYSASPTWIGATGLSMDSSATVYYGKTLTLVPTFLPSSDVINKEVVWTSDNPDVAIVDNNGIVYGKSIGTAHITAMALDGGFTATTTVTVALSPSYPSNAVLGSNLIIDSGMEGSTVPSAYYGSSATLTLNTAEHRNGAQSVRVTKTGNNRFGSMFLPTAIEQGKLYYYSVWGKLNAAPVNPALLRIGIQYKLDGVGKQKIMFSSTALGFGGWIQASGLYEIQEAGVVTDTRVYLYTEQADPLQDFYVDDIEVRQVSFAATSLSLNKSAVTLSIGQSETLEATVLPANATDKNVVWTSDHPATATVDSGGTVTAVGEGVAAITATAAGGTLSQSATVYVDATPPVTVAALSPSVPDGPAGTYIGPLSVSLSATDGLSSVMQTVYSVDNGTTWNPYATALVFDKQGSYTLQYKSVDQAGNEEPARSASFVLSATATSVELRDSAGNPLSGGIVKYYDGAWKDLGVTDAAGKATKSLPERSYVFSMTYQGVTKQLTQNTASNPVIDFRTVKAIFLLKDSQGNELAGGDAKLYTGGSWQTIGTTGSGELSKELFAGSYTIGMTYEGAYNQKAQNIGEDPAVVFQTASIVIQLKDAHGAPVDGGIAKVYSGGSWRTIGTTSSGEIRKELLPATYTFGMTYGTALANIEKDTATGQTVVFLLP
ncbi:Ig-like domain-containing protein [Cohnella lupini]|uniref:Carbohydrate binding protein n=1 Tax=Cohnella lupini TaxID=1294267 RepID=A0A3D9HYB8_9BACL|nr:Ig-like domain-containing protein [Cohnella lupini]RED54415.1 carbohydrate binding protein [Cohnella lupini]